MCAAGRGTSSGEHADVAERVRQGFSVPLGPTVVTHRRNLLRRIWAGLGAGRTGENHAPWLGHGVGPCVGESASQ